MNNKYEIGQEVWFYHTGFPAKRAKIIEKSYKHGYKIEIQSSVFKIETTIESYLYKYPEDREKLMSKMQEDAYDLLRYSKELE